MGSFLVGAFEEKSQTLTVGSFFEESVGHFSSKAPTKNTEGAHETWKPHFSKVQAQKTQILKEKI